MKKTAIASAMTGMLMLSGLALAEHDGYAEGIYQDYSVATGGAITFDVHTIESGELGGFSGLRFSELTGTPEYIVIADSAGVYLDNVAIVPTSQVKTLHLDDLDESLDGFEEAGFPLEKGVYRLLQIQLKTAEETHQHVAIESCWEQSGHCVVYDPSIEFLDSLVHNVRSLETQGWEIELDEEPADWTLLPKSAQVQGGRCGLSSRPWMTSRSASWPAYIFRIRNAFNKVVLEKTIGRAQSGLRCDVNCNPQPFGYANASSAWAKGLRSVACDNAASGGTEGSAGKFVTRTGCSHRTVFGAKFKAEAKGVGLEVDIDVDVTGSSHTNGQAFQDACAMF